MNIYIVMKDYGGWEAVVLAFYSEQAAKDYIAEQSQPYLYDIDTVWLE